MVQLAATLIVINYAPMILMLGLLIVAAPFALLGMIGDALEPGQASPPPCPAGPTAEEFRAAQVAAARNRWPRRERVSP